MARVKVHVSCKCKSCEQVVEAWISMPHAWTEDAIGTLLQEAGWRYLSPNAYGDRWTILCPGCVAAGVRS